MTDALEALAKQAGLEPRYTDAFGRPRLSPRASIAAALAALGFDGGSVTSLRAALVARERREARRLLPPVTVVRADRGPHYIDIAAPAGAKTLQWRLEAEDGEVSEGETAVSALLAGTGGRKRLPLPEPGLGYHRLEVQLGARRATQTLIVAPPRCYTPPALRKDERTWGFAVQLYTLRSERNWGIGDFTDLRRLAGLARSLGAGALSLNPLHANFLDDAEHASPYSPSSRRHFNPLYLDIEAIPEFAECHDARLRLADPALQIELARLRTADLVDYRGVAAVKRPLLERLYRHFRASHLDGEATPRGVPFRAFQEAGGRALRRFCVFHALREHLAAEDAALRDWRRWPAAYRDPDTETVRDFAARHAEAVAFHAYLQWQVSLQLEGVRDDCAGMPVGLVTDLALGADAAGAETWAAQDVYADGVSLGAPPDALNLRGQDWGLPPMSPLAMREQGYAAFAEILRANMRYAGAIRIDHVLGLMRQYWIPAGFPPGDGVYVRFPFEEVLGVLALESWRQQCLVIGEDLGTVPEGLRASLRDAGVLSYRLLLFERDESGDFLGPEAYPREAQVAATLHDLPTLPAYWTGDDLDLRQRLGLFPDQATHQAEQRQREVDLRRLTLALRRQQIPPDDDSAAPVLACYAYLARTPSMILQVQLEDLLGQKTPLNVPGTHDEYPNWRRKLRADLDELAALPDLHALGAAIRRARGPGTASTPPGEVWEPRATYRLQLNADFDFDAAAGIAAYLANLGISHVYASPYLRARRGSRHGYDIVNHAALNPEIGGEDALDRFVKALFRHGLGQILDFVPNHMGVGHADNAAWLDVLRWGEDSPYARTFDIDWRAARPDLHHRLLLPFLGERYGVALTRGDLVPRFDAESGGFDVWYHGHRFPLAPPDYAELIEAGLAEDCPAGLTGSLRALADAFRALRTEPGATLTARLRGESCRRALRHLVREHPLAGTVLERGAAAFSGRRGDGDSFLALHDLLERQAYRPAYWRIASSEINYRRFFDINELAAVRVEDDAVFDRVHPLVARLVAEGRLHGLRIDHIDGLAHPAGYLRRLRRLLARMRGPSSEEATYTVVEKILEPGEELPADWACGGTTGYDFMNEVLGLFIDPAGKPVLDRIHAASGGENDFAAVLYRAKTQVIHELFFSELDSLTTALDRLAAQSWNSRDYSRRELQRALAEVSAHFPVYRTYLSAAQGCSQRDRAVIAGACSRAGAQRPAAERDVFDFLETVLTGDLANDARYDAAAVLEIVRRFQQFCGPAMAKGLEDTAFYRHCRLVALNEVGGDPGRFGVPPEAFHAANGRRAETWPRTMLATATHDTKRGEDVRMRLAALSELAEDWAAAVERWNSLNPAHAALPPGLAAPTPLDTYLAYQTLVGAWPAELLDCDVSSAERELASYAARIKACLVKAVREAKLSTSWTSPNADYEAGVSRFVERSLDPAASGALLRDMQVFARRVAWLGALNSLSQTALKLTSPGVPDIYQGTELWDLSLVDPDNRRPVDFGRRAALLAQTGAAPKPAAVAALLAAWPDGRIKLHLLHRLLRLRSRAPDLFRDAGYKRLDVEGPEAERVVAFCRRAGDRELIVLAGRLLGALYDEDRTADWGETRVHWPAAGPLQDAITGARLHVSESGGIAVRQAFAVLPCAVLTRPHMPSQAAE